MNINNNLQGPNKNFENIKQVDENGVEFWSGRELMPLLGYQRWEAFEDVIGRAARSAINSDQTVDNHFRQLTKMVELGSGSKSTSTRFAFAPAP